MHYELRSANASKTWSKNEAQKVLQNLLKPKKDEKWCCRILLHWAKGLLKRLMCFADYLKTQQGFERSLKVLSQQQLSRL